MRQRSASAPRLAPREIANSIKAETAPAATVSSRMAQALPCNVRSCFWCMASFPADGPHASVGAIPMKAIVQTGYGSPEFLELREIDPPAVADDAVRVRIHAASINALDWHS